MKVTPEEIKEAYYHIRKEEGDALRFAAQRITAFHERQRTKTWMYQDGGATLGQVVTPIDAVGVYVPGGKAVYPSTVLMSAIPAKVAGVQRIVDVHAASERWDQSLSAGCSGHCRCHGNLSRGRRAGDRCAGIRHQDHRQSGQDRRSGQYLRRYGQADAVRDRRHRHGCGSQRVARRGG